MNDQPYRSIGIRLASFVQSHSQQALQTSTLQALVADLAGEQAELVMPLRDLVTRPAFRALIPLAGSGKGQLQRDALIEDMAQTFSPTVIAAIRAVLGGFLETTPHAPPAPQTSAAASWNIEESVVMPGTQAVEAEEPFSPQAERRVGPQPPSGSHSILELAGISALCAVLTAGGLAMLRSPLVCEPLGWCKAQSSHNGLQAPKPAGLQRARDAARAMDDAESVEAHEAALLKLEQALKELEGQNLTPEAAAERNLLQAEALAGRGLLREEETHRDQVERAARLLQDPSQADEARLTATTAALESIPARSFAAGEAGRIKADLARLQPSRESPPAQAVAPANQPQAQERPAIRAQIPYTPPPSPRPQPTRSPNSNPNAPYRDEPLW